MTQVFDPDGTVHPATVIKAGPCVVVQAKTAQTDGYEAVQLGLVEETPAKANKPTVGHFKKANVPATRVRREVKVGRPGETDDAPKTGDQVLVSIFANGERVDIDRHRPRQGIPGRRQAAPLRRRRGDARLDVPSRARIDWRLVVSLARHQGHAGARDGWAAAA